MFVHRNRIPQKAEGIFNVLQVNVEVLLGNLQRQRAFECEMDCLMQFDSCQLGNVTDQAETVQCECMVSEVGIRKAFHLCDDKLQRIKLIFLKGNKH